MARKIDENHFRSTSSGRPSDDTGRRRSFGDRRARKQPICTRRHSTRGVLLVGRPATITFQRRTRSGELAGADIDMHVRLDCDNRSQAWIRAYHLDNIAG